MKKNIYKVSGVIALSMALLSACDNAGYEPVGNGLYISEAAPEKYFSQQVENLVVSEDITTSIHLRVAQPVDTDIHVQIGLAPEFMSEYNTRNNSSYQVLPEKYLSFEKEVVIKAGNLASDPVIIGIKEFETPNGESYCVPLKIVSSDASIDIMPASSRIMYLLSSPLKQKVPVMKSSTMPTGSGDWGIATSEWTLEGWIWLSSFSINNQAIFAVDVSEGTEIYVRFGDANVDYDRLQIKTGGSQFESNMTFSPETWYHIAITYTNGKCTLYVDGEEDSSKDISTNYVINNLSLCSSGSYFRANGKMAQVRFWKKALPQEVIKDAKNREVPSDSDGLFGYWKLNEGQGSTYKDATSNGYDLTCAVAPTWSEEEVNFSDPNKK